MKKNKKDSVDVVIETPKDCRNKYAWDEKEKVFRLKKILPLGSVFPFDFGFVPGTKGGDGDPLDVLVIMDEPAFPGCVLECRIVGVLKARQTERDKKTETNDRLIGVSVLSELYSDIEDINALSENILRQIEQFFVSYNQLAGKKFEPQGWAGAEEARKLIATART
ncbi:inorganic diphosphatase [Flavisolibacter ginsenosidimutans]|uniref:inorganic diphosphatase n=1 Tax=Flavisolibacter ginsenosidimutans TaxID=661481 RepID=A0A5B8UHQ5_9BACT|nr:inorganic diphosphatase [Flavisolibacter ginsenosidimutans]QEC56053.1 inorganic diphosphatase [Flavisolibacter ginsenosidimutans]